MKIYIYLKMTCVILLAIIILPISSFAKEKATYNTLTVDIAACLFSRLNIELTKNGIRLIAPFQKDYPDMVTIPGSHPKCHADNISETRIHIKKLAVLYPSQTDQLSFVINAKNDWKRKREGYVWESCISKLGIYHDPVLLTAESYETSLGSASIYMINRNEKWNIAAIEPYNEEGTENRKTYEPDYYDWQFIYAFEDFVSSGDFQTAHITIEANAKEDFLVKAANERLLIMPKEPTSSDMTKLKVSVNGMDVVPAKEDGQWSMDLSKVMDMNIYQPGRILNLRAINGDTGQNIRRTLVKQSLPNQIDVKHGKRAVNFRFYFDYIYFAQVPTQENQ